MKKWITIIICLILCVSTFFTMSLAVTDTDVFAAGDVNGDRYVNALDALLVLKHAVGKIQLTPEQIIRADVSYISYEKFPYGPYCEKPGVIDAIDAVIILHLACDGWPPLHSFPC